MNSFKLTFQLLVIAAMLSLAMGGVAFASGSQTRDSLNELADLVEMSGQSEQASEMRAHLAMFSDDELFEAYADVDLSVIVDSQAALVDNLLADPVSADSPEAQAKAGASPGNKRSTPGWPTIDWAGELGAANSHPGLSLGQRSNTPTNIAQWKVIHDFEKAMILAENVIEVSRDGYNICAAVAQQVVVGGGIGVCAGGNASAVCAVVAGATTAAQIIYAGTQWDYLTARIAQDQKDYLDTEIADVEIETMFDEMNHLHNDLASHVTTSTSERSALSSQITTHDAQIKQALAEHDARVNAHIDTLELQVGQHDTDIKNKLDQQHQEVMASLTRMEGNQNMLLKTQLEQMLILMGGRRSGVLVNDRLAEVCDAAEDAIDDAEANGYVVPERASDLYAEGVVLMNGGDPKRAHDACRAAFQMAVSRSLKRANP